MKKCLNGFLVMLMILICPTLKVNALTMEELPALPTEYSTNNYEIVTNQVNNTFLYFYEDQYLFTINGINNSFLPSSTTSIIFGGTTTATPLEGFPDTIYAYTYQLNKTTNTWDYKGYLTTSTMLSCFDANSGVSFTDFRNDPTTITPYLKQKVIYTNVNHFYTPDKGQTFIQILSANDYIKEYLTHSLTRANDLEGNDIYNIRFNAINYNPNYQYLIKTSQEVEWTDITELLNNEALQYDYILRYNTTLFMQVLDNDNNILESKTLTIADLEEYGFIITHNLAEDLNTRPVYAIRVDARLVYNDNYTYQYTYDGQTYYNMDIVDNVYIMNHALNIPISYRILDDKDNVIYTQIYGADFSEMERRITFNEKTNIVDNKKQIVIGIDFTEYLKFYDMYNFRVFIEDKEYNLQDAFYVELILTEENYIKAIDIKLMLDNMTIEQFQHRLGTLNGTGGGSDTDFNGMYDNVLENELENEIKEQDYTTISGMVEAVKNFIKATSEFITTFFELIMYFFNKLNIWIRTCIIALFIELIIFKTIKAVRK